MFPVILPLITAVLPYLLPAVAEKIAGEPGGEVARKVIAVAQEVTGQSEPDAVAAALKADPAAVARLQERLAELQVEVVRVQAADRADARQQTIALVRAGSPLAYGAALVSLIVLGTFGLVLWLVLTAQIPSGQERIADTLVGILGTLAVGCVQYWVGSSSGSAQKTELLRR
jgi:hypothetical protein